MSADSFSARIFAQTDQRFAVPADQQADNELLYLAVRNQLLIDHDTALPVLLPVLDGAGLSYQQLTSLYADDLPGIPAKGDVDVYQVDGADDIFDLVDELRTVLEHHKPRIDPSFVSPNHVLIPAPLEGHGCPHGPPHPIASPGVLVDPEGVHRVPVTVIDSGWQWDDSWGDNPVAGHLAGDPIRAKRVPTAQESATLGIKWKEEALDLPGETILDVNGNPRLVALAGHANFIAGVIAQRCPNAAITIINHLGTYEPTADDFPTEASVAHSLMMAADAQVINVGFAFASYGHKISHAWRQAFNYLAANCDPMPMVFAPAGNQDSSIPRYPAAFPHPNMVGVGALDENGLRASFSNHGSSKNNWIKCSARGQDVRSTFLCVDMVLEDGDEHDQDFTPNSWASWNGTSFSTPWVVGAVAANIDPANPDPAGAWDDLKQNHPKVPLSHGNHNIGTLFQV
jgi:hypothetical protein